MGPQWSLESWPDQARTRDFVPRIPIYRSRLRPSFQQSLEIGTGALGFRAGCVGGFAKTEIAVDQTFTGIVRDLHVGALKHRNIARALVAQGIEPCGAND